MPETLGIIVSVAGVGVALLLALVGTAWQLGGRLQRIESDMDQRLERLEGNMDQRLERLEGNMDQRLERLEGNMDRRLERLEGNMDRRLERIEGNIGDLGAGIRSLNQQVASIVALVSSAFMFMHRGRSITDEEYYNVAAQFTRLISLGTEPFIDRLTHDANPLTPSEAGRFRELVGKARRGEFFTREEVEEYSLLIEKIQLERPNDNGIWPLVALGAFLRGLYPSRQQD